MNAPNPTIWAAMRLEGGEWHILGMVIPNKGAMAIISASEEIVRSAFESLDSVTKSESKVFKFVAADQ